MAAQNTQEQWEDSIDLRKWIGALVRYKFLILGITMATIGAAALLSYVLLTPTYKSSAGAALPSANGAGQLGLTLRGYQVFATSTPVMEEVTSSLT